MQMVLERTVGLPTSMPYSVECPSVSLISNFSNGSKVTLSLFSIIEKRYSNALLTLKLTIFVPASRL